MSRLDGKSKISQYLTWAFAIIHDTVVICDLNAIDPYAVQTDGFTV